MVVSHVRELLDEFFPLTSGSHADAVEYTVNTGVLTAELADGTLSGLREPDVFLGYKDETAAPSAILLRHHGLHFEIVIDPSTEVGRTDPAGICDVLVESAITTIIDFEDSVSAVDAEDKVLCYRNWLGLNRGDLTDTFEKRGEVVVRRLEPDRVYKAANDSGEVTLPGRSLLFVRNVGHLMTTDAVLDAMGDEIGEGIMDAVLTTLTALPGRSASSSNRKCTAPKRWRSRSNSSGGSRNSLGCPQTPSNSGSWMRNGEPALT
jgi:malate synthase